MSLAGLRRLQSRRARVGSLARLRPRPIGQVKRGRSPASVPPLCACASGPPQPRQCPQPRRARSRQPIALPLPPCPACCSPATRARGRCWHGLHYAHGSTPASPPRAAHRIAQVLASNRPAWLIAPAWLISKKKADKRPCQPPKCYPCNLCNMMFLNRLSEQPVNRAASYGRIAGIEDEYSRIGYAV